MASRRVYTTDPETGYRKGAVSGNKRMTDISGDPDREFAVALSASCHVFHLDFYRFFSAGATMSRSLREQSRDYRSCLCRIAFDDVKQKC